MRYRLMASYLGASYQAAVGPSDRDVTLFAAPPPPEEHGFSPAPGGIWYKQVRLDELDALWESRPIGSYHGEPCLVLDDLGDRLHIAYLGMDERRAGQLGYWQVDRGVFEVVVKRHEVTDLAEERHEFPIALLLSTLPRALTAADPGTGVSGNGTAPPGTMPGSGMAGAAGMAATGTGTGTRNGAGAIERMALPSGGPGMAGQTPGGGNPMWNGQPSGPYPATPAAQQRGHFQHQPGPQPPPGSPQLATGARAHAASPIQPQPLAAGIQQQASATGQQPGMGSYPAPTGTPQADLGVPGIPTAPGLPTGAPSRPHGTQGNPQGIMPGAQQPATAPQPPGMGQLPAAPLPEAPPAGTPGSGMPRMPQAPAPPPQEAAEQQGAAQHYQVAGQFPAAQQGTSGQQAAGAPPPPNGQPSTDVTAWHGSPVPNGNGTWYYQSDTAAQHSGVMQNGLAQNGLAQNGLAQNGLAQNGTGPAGSTGNGYARPEQSVTQAVQPNGLSAASHFPQAGQPPQTTAYQQDPPLQPASPAAQPSQFPQFAQQPQTAQAAQQTAQVAQVPQAPNPAAQPTPQSGQPSAPGQAAPVSSAAAMTAPPLSAPPLSAPPQPAVSDPVESATTGPLSPLAPRAAPPGLARQDRLSGEQDRLSGEQDRLSGRQDRISGEQDRLSGGQAEQADQASGALNGPAGAVRGRRAARKPRLAMSAIFADLVDMADIPRSAYAVDDEVTGAMCLFKTDGGYEVFSCAEDARHEVRFFEEEEAAYFYLFGVLAAEALRNGRLSPRRS